MPTNQRIYIAIDLKSFFASVECAERGLDPLTTNLVVADESRTEKTICLAVSPSLKAYGISGRARLFEAVARVEEINRERKNKLKESGREPKFTGKSYNDIELKAHPDWEIDFIRAVPRMSYYSKYSSLIYNIYQNYIAAEDIHSYSIDEVFMDVTNYLHTYKISAHELAMKIIHDVLKQTGITATAGIGTNLYLCKIAMDIVAKHIPADKDGVRIAELDEMTYRKLLWNHRPLSNFWRFGNGIVNRLAMYGIDTMGKLARFSLSHEEVLYQLFGMNAELIIDHAWGWEPCTISDIKAYKTSDNSLCSCQVLQHPYSFVMGRVVIQEMAEAAALNLFKNQLLTNQIDLYIGYDVENLKQSDKDSDYQGPLHNDHYGRTVPKPAHGLLNLEEFTSSSKTITEAVLALYDRIVNPKLLIRRLNIATNHIISESEAKKQEKMPIELDLFTDYEALAKQNKKKEEDLAKEKRMQESIIDIKQRFGKNAILKGLNFREGATACERNLQIGGHKA